MKKERGTRRIVSLFLVAFMLVSASGCGGSSTPATLFDAMKEMSKVETYTFTSDLKMKAIIPEDLSGVEELKEVFAALEESTISINGSADTKKGAMQATVKVANPTALQGALKDGISLNLIISDETFYLDLSEIVDTALKSLNMKEEDLISYAKQELGIDVSSLPSIRCLSMKLGPILSDEKIKTAFRTISDTLNDSFQKAAENTKELQITGEKGKYSFSITKENLIPLATAMLDQIQANKEVLVDALATIAENFQIEPIAEQFKPLIEMDDPGAYDTFIKEFKDSVNGVKDKKENALKNVDELIKNIKEELTDSSEIEDSLDLTMDYTLDVTTESGSKVYNINQVTKSKSKVSQDEQFDLENNVTTVIKEAKSVEINVPKESTSITDITNLLLNSSGTQSVSKEYNNSSYSFQANAKTDINNETGTAKSAVPVTLSMPAGDGFVNIEIPLKEGYEIDPSYTSYAFVCINKVSGKKVTEDFIWLTLSQNYKNGNAYEEEFKKLNSEELIIKSGIIKAGGYPLYYYLKDEPENGNLINTLVAYVELSEHNGLLFEYGLNSENTDYSIIADNPEDFLRSFFNDLKCDFVMSDENGTNNADYGYLKADEAVLTDPSNTVCVVIKPGADMTYDIKCSTEKIASFDFKDGEFLWINLENDFDSKEDYIDAVKDSFAKKKEDNSNFAFDVAEQGNVFIKSIGDTLGYIVLSSTEGEKTEYSLFGYIKLKHNFGLSVELEEYSDESFTSLGNDKDDFFNRVLDNVTVNYKS